MQINTTLLPWMTHASGWSMAGRDRSSCWWAEPGAVALLYRLIDEDFGWN
jgi:hypothetical protein